MRVAGIEPKAFLLQALAHQHKIIQEEIAKGEPNAAVIANAYAKLTGEPGNAIDDTRNGVA
jgi:hypothetical protein